MDDILIQLSETLTRGDHENTARLTGEAVAAGIEIKRVLDDGLISGMSLVGEKFRRHEIFLPDVLLAARAMYAGLEILKPLLIRDNLPSRGKIVLGTVQGDVHDIGKNLVGIMLRGAGFEVIDLGHDVPPEKFVATAVSENASVVGLSALLTTTMPVMKKVVALVHERGLTGRIKVAVGGAPVTRQFAQDIGADAYGFDAVNAVECITRLIETGRTQN